MGFAILDNDLEQKAFEKAKTEAKSSAPNPNFPGKWGTRPPGR